MSGKKIIVVFAIFLASLFFLNKDICIASEKEQGDSEEILIEQFLEDSDLSDIQKILNDNLEQVQFSFMDYMIDLVKGKVSFSMESVASQVKDAFFQDIKGNKSFWYQCLSIAIIAAFFSNLATIFQNKMVGEVGYYIGYLILFTLLVSGFSKIFSVAEQLLMLFVFFMKALIPVYFMMAAASNGSVAAAGGYQMALLAIGVVEFVIGKIVLPAVEIYFMLVLINHLSKEDKLSRLLELLEMGIKWAMKGMLGMIVGLNAVQGLLLPGIQKVRQNVILKTSEVIPVVGDALSGITETVLSVAGLLRNAVGVAGVTAILLLAIVPVLKIISYSVIFRLEAVFLQPLGEKNMCDCFVGMAKTAEFLLYIEVVSMLLFCLTLLIVSYSLGG